MRMKLDLTENEQLCKYFYQNGFDFALLFKEKENEQTLFGMDLTEFQQDSMTSFAKAVQTFNEDFLIPKNMDVHVLRQPRYMPVKDHSHDFIEFVYMYQGDCTQFINGIEIEAQEGDLFLLAPGIFHHITTYSDDNIVLYVMIRISTFQKAFMSLLKQSDLLSAFFAHVIYGDNPYPYLLFITGKDQTLRSWIFSMYQEALAKDSYSDRMLNTQFEWMCLYLLRNHIGQMDLYGQGGRAVKVMEMLGYITDNFKEITLSAMAEHFKYSSGYLCRLIKKTTGLTFTDLVLRTRLGKACDLLCNSDIPIFEIARVVGFCDTSNFYKAFNRQYQQTPANYRKQCQTKPQ